MEQENTILIAALKREKMTAKQRSDLLKKQKGSVIPKAPKSHMTDDVVDFLKDCYEKQPL